MQKRTDVAPVYHCENRKHTLHVVATEDGVAPDWCVRTFTQYGAVRADVMNVTVETALVRAPFGRG
jgi:hypothetical protein